MKQTTTNLYELLPVIYRQRDYEHGEPLKALLQVMSEQLELVEGDISQLYDNWFIETCEDWVVPYIGELIGYDVLHEGGEITDTDMARDRDRNSLLIPRREVANTIRYRRRKGTLALLELLARSVACWSARAVEFHPLMHKNQAINYLRMERGQSIDLHHAEKLQQLGTAFCSSAHGIDVRRIDSVYKPGRYNCSSIGLFVWRLNAYSLTGSPAYCKEAVNPACFTFSALGNDTPLFVDPKPDADPHHIADEVNLPMAISRSLLERRLPELYGRGRSLQIWVGKSSKGKKEQVRLESIRTEDIIVTDLSLWNDYPPAGKVAVDPQLGRIAFPSRRAPKQGVWVSYHYGFSDAVGGGEYQRKIHHPKGSKIYFVGQGQELDTINAALREWRKDCKKWRKDCEKLRKDGEKPPKDCKRHAVIEITDNRVYVEPVNINFADAHFSLQLRAANSKRPVIRLLDWQTDKADALVISGFDQNRFTLDGILIAGRGIQVTGDMINLSICHSTLVPGWSLDEHCEPQRPAEPSIEIQSPGVCVTIKHSIVGSIQLDPAIAIVEVKQEPELTGSDEHCDDGDDGENEERYTEIRLDPIAICISDSILDATGEEREAIGAPGCPVAHARLTIKRSTLIGQVQVDSIYLAENSIFNGRVLTARTQKGCVRFCYVPPGSRTPRRYHCQPDLVIEGLSADRRELEQQRVKPLFNSLRYGMPDYCQLSLCCAKEISEGADDESEMGVFHDLYQPQRLANLNIRLNEYVPAGSEVGIIFES